VIALVDHEFAYAGRQKGAVKGIRIRLNEDAADL
jgi:hypothetical protein